MDQTAVGVVILIALLYFVPSIVAAGRERNGGVLVLNFFLGWTLVGWVVALAWAASLPHRSKTAASTIGPPGESIAVPALVRCPFCAEDIKPEAVVCKHCGRDLPAKEST